MNFNRQGAKNAKKKMSTQSRKEKDAKKRRAVNTELQIKKDI